MRALFDHFLALVPRSSVLGTLHKVYYRSVNIVQHSSASRTPAIKDVPWR